MCHLLKNSYLLYTWHWVSGMSMLYRFNATISICNLRFPTLLKIDRKNDLYRVGIFIFCYWTLTTFLSDFLHSLVPFWKALLTCRKICACARSMAGSRLSVTDARKDSRTCSDTQRAMDELSRSDTACRHTTHHPQLCTAGTKTRTICPTNKAQRGLSNAAHLSYIYEVLEWRGRRFIFKWW